MYQAQSPALKKTTSAKLSLKPKKNHKRESKPSLIQNLEATAWQALMIFHLLEAKSKLHLHKSRRNLMALETLTLIKITSVTVRTNWMTPKSDCKTSIVKMLRVSVSRCPLLRWRRNNNLFPKSLPQGAAEALTSRSKRWIIKTMKTRLKKKFRPTVMPIFMRLATSATVLQKVGVLMALELRFRNRLEWTQALIRWLWTSTTT